MLPDAVSSSPCFNFHHDPMTIFPIKYLGIDEHGENYNYFAGNCSAF